MYLVVGVLAEAGLVSIVSKRHGRRFVNETTDTLFAGMP